MGSGSKSWVGNGGFFWWYILCLYRRCQTPMSYRPSDAGTLFFHGGSPEFLDERVSSGIGRSYRGNIISLRVVRNVIV